MASYFCVYENAFLEVYLLDRFYSVKYQLFAGSSVSLVSDVIEFSVKTGVCTEKSSWIWVNNSLV